MDPTAFFSMIFGSEAFEPLVGELQMATMMRLSGDEDLLLDPAELKRGPAASRRGARARARDATGRRA